MISFIEWIPAGVADPSPKKYELSTTEMELLQNQGDPADDDDEEDMEEEDNARSGIQLPKVDPSTLAPELRMDEYSSDEDEHDAVRGSTLGKMLVGKVSNVMVGTRIGDDGMPVDDADGENDANNDAKTDTAVGELEEDSADDQDDDDDDDNDDDLEDVPDTREFMPVDVEGLEAMGLSHIGTGGHFYLEDWGNEENDDDSDAEDLKLAPGDALIISAKTEEDFASLDVHVYEQKTGNLFVHHDIPLPSFPLCLAHGEMGSDGAAGNFCAVGTFSPGIEVWNLDVINALEPLFILGGENMAATDEMMKRNVSAVTNPKKSRKSKLSNNGLRPGSHTDAIMSLSWNKVHKQVIASGSADTTVKLWDVTKAGGDGRDCNVTTFTHHRDKVQSVMWHPSEGTLLATGSYDRTVALVDARSGGANCKKVKIPADCEALAWDPFQSQHLTVASEDGTISCWDVRKFDTHTPLWSFVANEFGGVSDLSYNPLVPGLLVTCATDRTVTLWDAHHSNSSSPPHPCGTKDMQVGKLYSVSFYPSSPWLLGCGGSGGELALWDLSSESPLLERFGSRISAEAAIKLEEDATETEIKTEEFEAIMANASVPEHEVKVKTENNNKKGKDSRKKKVHRKGR